MKNTRKEKLSFRVDSVNLLTEIVDCALRENQGILKIPINIFRNLLAQVAQRATELNDPEMNVLMLSLGLYEVDAKEIPKMIQEEKKLIKKTQNND